MTAGGNPPQTYTLSKSPVLIGLIKDSNKNAKDADKSFLILDKPKQLTYTEFSFESEAKGDNLIGVHQTKVVKV